DPVNPACQPATGRTGHNKRADNTAPRGKHEQSTDNRDHQAGSKRHHHGISSRQSTAMTNLPRPPSLRTVRPSPARSGTCREDGRGLNRVLVLSETVIGPAGIGWGDARASEEFRAVLAEELGHRARGASGDLLEGAGGVVVLAGEDRPLARDEQLSRPRRYPGAGEALEELPLGRDLEGDGLAEFGRQQFERLRPRQGDRPGQVVVRAPQRRVGEHAHPGLGRVAMVDQGHAAAVGQAGPGARCAHLTPRGEQRRRAALGEGGGAPTPRPGASSDAEKIAGRIVEYGTAVEAANKSMLSWARWLIPSESAEVLSTDRRGTW